MNTTHKTYLLRTLRFILCTAIISAFLTCSFGSVNAASENLKTIEISLSKYDLDGDDKKDYIHIELLEIEEGSDVYSADISINGKKLKIESLYKPKSTITVLDIDKKDGYQEIAVSEYGAASSTKTHIVGYNGRYVYLIGKVEGFPEKDGFDVGKGEHFFSKGDGKISASVRSDLLQTWWMKATYNLVKTNLSIKPYELEIQQQKIFSSSTQNNVTVTKSFQAYNSMDENGQKRIVSKGSTLTLTGSDEKQWVRFKDSNSKVGYILMDNFSEIKGYSSASMHLSGLQIYD